MKRNYLILSLFIVVSTFFFVNCSKKDNKESTFSNSKENALTNKTKYIVFSNTYFWEKSTNNAVLITDDVTINSLNKLHNNDLTIATLSGYDYQIHFYDKDNNDLYTTRILFGNQYSQNNDEIQATLKKIINTINVNPTHCIYNLKVSKEFKADSIIDILRTEGFESVLLGDLREQNHLKSYFVQLLSKDSLEEIKSKVHTYTFIEDISKANNGFIYKE